MMTKGQFHQSSTSSFYTARRSKSAKMIDNFTVFFALLVSVSTKAARKMLVKLTSVDWKFATSQDKNRAHPVKPAGVSDFKSQRVI